MSLLSSMHGRFIGSGRDFFSINKHSRPLLLLDLRSSKAFSNTSDSQMDFEANFFPTFRKSISLVEMESETFLSISFFLQNHRKKSLSKMHISVGIKEIRGPRGKGNVMNYFSFPFFKVSLDFFFCKQLWRLELKCRMLDWVSNQLEILKPCMEYSLCKKEY